MLHWLAMRTFVGGLAIVVLFESPADPLEAGKTIEVGGRATVTFGARLAPMKLGKITVAAG